MALFTADTVDSILASFETHKAKLAALATKLREGAAKDKAEADALLEQSKAKSDEALRAARVADKIGKLID